MYQSPIILDSLSPGNAIWQHRFKSTFAQVMACCLMTPSHYLKQTNVDFRASQNPIRSIRRTRAADLGLSLSMFKKAAAVEFSYKIMYVCMAAEKNFVMSWLTSSVRFCDIQFRLFSQKCWKHQIVKWVSMKIHLQNYFCISQGPMS